MFHYLLKGGDCPDSIRKRCYSLHHNIRRSREESAMPSIEEVRDAVEYFKTPVGNEKDIEHSRAILIMRRPLIQGL